MKKSEFLLDLRCGGGWELLTKKATKVVGVDFSRPSPKVAKKLHYDCVEANIEHLPFSSCSFDFVTSSDVLGHIQVNSKEGVMSEMLRAQKEVRETFH